MFDVSSKPTPRSLSEQSYAKRDFIDRLKISTCLTSAWVYTFAAGGLIVSGYDQDQRALVAGGVVALTIASSIGKGFLSLLFKNTAGIKSEKPVFVTPPKSLTQIYHDIMEDMDVNRYVPLRYFQGNEGLAYYNYLSQNISIGERLYKKLNHTERRFVVAHELAHVHHQDDKLHNLVRLPIYASMGFAPFMPSALTSLTAGGSLSAAFTMLGGATLGLLGCAFTKAVGQRAYRYSEYRADRKAVLTEGSPLPAISVLSKIDTPVRQGKGGLKGLWDWIKSDINGHPSRNRRFISITRDFSEAYPDNRLDLYYSRALYKSPDKASHLYVDARRLDGRIYCALPYGFHQANQGINNLTKI